MGQSQGPRNVGSWLRSSSHLLIIHFSNCTLLQTKPKNVACQPSLRIAKVKPPSVNEGTIILWILNYENLSCKGRKIVLLIQFIDFHHTCMLWIYAYITIYFSCKLNLTHHGAMKLVEFSSNRVFVVCISKANFSPYYCEFRFLSESV